MQHPGGDHNQRVDESCDRVQLGAQYGGIYLKKTSRTSIPSNVVATGSA
ncbi:hypothetical protein JAO29_16475 [Edaphobacter sp. HDX4]